MDNELTPLLMNNLKEFCSDNKNNLVIEYKDGKSSYCRNMSMERRILQNNLLNYYGFNNNEMNCHIFPSGVCAITCLANIFSTGKSMFLTGNELYCDSSRICKYISKINKDFTFEKFDVRNSENIINLFKKYNSNINLFFIESCTNPSGQIFDFSLLIKLKELAPNCIFCVDNTWLSGCNFNPFQVSNGIIDIVIESMTKYISGGLCIGGMMISKPIYMDLITNYSKSLGLYVSSDHCLIFSKTLKTVESRISKMSINSIELARYLESKKEINRVMHSLLDSHPTNELAKRYLKYSPSVILIHINHNHKNKEQIMDIIRSNSYFLAETSYGSSESRIDVFPKYGNSYKYDFKKKHSVKGIWIRLAVGSDSNLDLLKNGCDELINKILDN